MRESDIEKKVVGKLWHLGINSVKIHATSFPDRLFLVPGGRPLFVEFKSPARVATPLQQSNHKMLESLGYRVLIIDSLDFDTVKNLVETCFEIKNVK